MSLAELIAKLTEIQDKCKGYAVHVPVLFSMEDKFVGVDYVDTYAVSRVEELIVLSVGLSANTKVALNYLGEPHEKR